MSRIEGAQRRQDRLIESRAEFVRSGRRGEGGIHDITMIAAFVQSAGTGVQRRLMGGRVKQVGLIPEHCLRAVAVVHVEIDDRRTREAMRRLGMGGTDGDAVEQTETHGDGLFGMMPRRTDRAEGHCALRRRRRRRPRRKRRLTPVERLRPMRATHGYRHPRPAGPRPELHPAPHARSRAHAPAQFDRYRRAVLRGGPDAGTPPPPGRRGRRATGRDTRDGGPRDRARDRLDAYRGWFA